MIHVKMIRIWHNNKLFKRKLKNCFVRSEEELDRLLEQKQNKYLKAKFPNGIPEQNQDSRVPFCTTDSTHITIPDKEFLHYLVTILNMKSIPEKYVELLKPKEL